MRKRVLYSLICLATLIIASCERQKIYDPELLTAKIPIVIDWTKSLVNVSDINNVSVYFYPKDGSEPIVFYSSDPYVVTASVKEGSYDVLVHNEMAGNIKGVECVDDKIIDSYKMFKLDNNTDNYQMFYTPAANEHLIHEGEALACWSYTKIDVTSDMIEYTRTRSFEEMITRIKSKSQTRTNTKSSEIEFTNVMTRSYSEMLSRSSDDEDTKSVTKSLSDFNGVQPLPITSTYELKLEIINMNNIQFIEGVINGFVDGVEVFSGNKIRDLSQNNYTYFMPTEHKFNEGSTTDGVVTYRFTNFGHILSNNANDYKLTINIITHDGVLHSKVIDITDKIREYEVSHSIYINIGDDFNNGTESIELPESTKDGFSVGDWGDAENVEL